MKTITIQNTSSNFKYHDLTDVKRYMGDRIKELRSDCNRGNPWVFANCCTLIDSISYRMYGNTESSRSDFINFCKKYLYPNRKQEQLKTSKGDVFFIDQLYHILRCGIVHGFSMLPELRLKNGKLVGFPGTILLSHQNQDTHFEKVKLVYGNYNTESYIITAEDFVNDIENAVNQMLKDPTDSNTLVSSFNKTPVMNWYDLKVT